MRRLSWFLWAVRVGGIVLLLVLHLERLEAGRRQHEPLRNGETRHDRKYAFADSIERAQDGAVLLLGVVLALGVVEASRLPWSIEHAASGATSGCLFDVLAAVFLVVYAFNAFMTHALGFT